MLRHKGFYLIGAIEQNSEKTRHSFPITEEHVPGVTHSAVTRDTCWFRAELPDMAYKSTGPRDAWVAQLVEYPTSAQVVISQSVSSSPASGSVLTAQSLEPASHSVSPSLSAPPPLTLCLRLSKMNKH